MSANILRVLPFLTSTTAFILAVLVCTNTYFTINGPVELETSLNVIFHQYNSIFQICNYTNVDLSKGLLPISKFPNSSCATNIGLDCNIYAPDNDHVSACRKQVTVGWAILFGAALSGASIFLSIAFALVAKRAHPTTTTSTSTIVESLEAKGGETGEEVVTPAAVVVETTTTEPSHSSLFQKVIHVLGGTVRFGIVLSLVVVAAAGAAATLYAYVSMKTVQDFG